MTVWTSVHQGSPLRNEDNIKEYLINSELPEDEEESFYVEYLSDDMDISSSSDYEIGMAYVMAVAEREDISYREAVRWIDKNKKKKVGKTHGKDRGRK